MNNVIRVYIQSGLVQHVDSSAGIPVRIIDLDTEGSPASDLQRLSKADILALPEGLEDERSAFITTWKNGEAVSRA
jgi:hypothetical protein